MARYRIGYIDENDSEVKTFQRKLRDYQIEVVGYEFTQGMTKEELLAQVYSSNIDLLLIDYKLKGQMVTFNGEEIENDIYENKPLFPYIIFTSYPPQAEDYIEDWKSIYDKQELFSDDTIKNGHFVNTLIKSIEQYKSHIQKKKAAISELLEKGNKSGLNASEKDRLLSIQRDLQNLDKTIVKEVPEQMASYQRVEDLSKARKDAEQFLKSLTEKKC